MNISTGLSEINLQSLKGGTSGPQKIFTWPAYSQNKIDAIKPFSRQQSSGPLYIKPAPEEKEQLLRQLHSKGDSSYDAGGRGVSENKIIKPGSFFDAIV